MYDNLVKYFKRYLRVAPLSLSIWRAQEAKLIEETLLKRPILDIGCGFGEFSGVFFDRLVEMGIDINCKDLVMAEKQYKHLVIGDARLLPYDDCKFSTVLSVSTLENLENVEEVFPQAYRVLKHGGLFVFSVPTEVLNSYLLVPSLFRRLGFSYFADLYLKAFHRVFKHKVIVPKSWWISQLKNAGFELVQEQSSISKKQLWLFEMTLLFALPGQISRFFYRKRIFWSLPLRWKINYRLFKGVLNDAKLTDANVVITARKN